MTLGSPHAASDGVAFAKVLPFCRSVRGLYLESNAIGDEGCVAIADAVAAGGAGRYRAAVWDGAVGWMVRGMGMGRRGGGGGGGGGKGGGGCW